jgi:alkanesulfonate monooxygenase SsuD/methylene tetrahydromethanopterin reductase-like flavin-dependent oxidoreductase (luciferase family)
VACGTFGGEFTAFDAVMVNPKPVPDSGIPIMVGGNSDAALQRVAAWGDGWYGFNLDGAAAVGERIDALTRSCAAAGSYSSRAHRPATTMPRAGSRRWRTDGPGLNPLIGRGRPGSAGPFR